MNKTKIEVDSRKDTPCTAAWKEMFGINWQPPSLPPTSIPCESQKTTETSTTNADDDNLTPRSERNDSSVVHTFDDDDVTTDSSPSPIGAPTSVPALAPTMNYVLSEFSGQIINGLQNGSTPITIAGSSIVPLIPHLENCG